MVKFFNYLLNLIYSLGNNIGAGDILTEINNISIKGIFASLSNIISHTKIYYQGEDAGRNREFFLIKSLSKISKSSLTGADAARILIIIYILSLSNNNVDYLEAILPIIITSFSLRTDLSKTIKSKIIIRFYPGSGKNVKDVVNAVKKGVEKGIEGEVASSINSGIIGNNNNTENLTQEQKAIVVAKKFGNELKEKKENNNETTNTITPNKGMDTTGNAENFFLESKFSKLNENTFSFFGFIKNLFISESEQKKNNLLVNGNFPGIWTPQPSFYTDKIYSKDVEKVLYKIIMDTLGNTKINSHMDLGITFVNVLKYSESLDLQKDYYYPMIQHMLVCIFYKVKFPKNVLLTLTKNKINYSAFPELVSVQTIIEGIIFINGIDFLDHNSIKIIAQNHENPHNSAFLIKESKKLTGQPYSDYHCQIKYLEENGFFMGCKNSFFDVKLKTNSIVNLHLMKGCVSVSTKINKKDYIEKITYDLKSNYEQKNKGNLLEEKEKLILKKISDDIINIRNDRKISIEQKYSQITSILKKTFLNPDIVSINFSIFFEFLGTNVYIVPTEVLHTEVLNTEVFFPKKGNAIDFNKWEVLYKKTAKILKEDTNNEELKSILSDNIKSIDYL